MDDHEDISNGIQKFDGRNYAYWSDRVKTYLTALGVDIWYSVVNGYVIPNNAPTDPNAKKLMSCNSKARHVILESLTPTIASKVMGCNTAKEVWDKLKNIYEGDPKVKQVKLQRHRAEFENLKMNEKEDIATYLLRFDEVVNAIRGLGEEIDESLVVQKVLGSLLLKYDAKVSAIEERATQTVDEKWTRISERMNDYKRDEYPRRPPTFRNQRSSNQYEGNYRRIYHETRWTTSQRSPLTPRYQIFFLCHCYTCKIFGHKAMNCRINERNKYRRNMNGVKRRYGNNHGFVNRSYNSFYPLMDKNIVCYKCNYLGHKARDCRYMNEDVPMPTTVWRRKEIPNNEDCRIALTAEKCKEEDEWYIDSGCSSHMTGDQDKFISLKRKGGNVAFGDDSSAKILGEGVVELGRKNVKAKNVLLVEDLNHNLLSVSKMCDQGYTLTFDSRKCKIRENNSGRLVATATRRPNNIYILDMKKREKTEATQKDSKEENVPKTKNKDEVLLSATCLGGAAPKKKVTFFH
jgi:hypothetical protein